MSRYELNRSITAATDAFDQVVSLQELLLISLDIAGQSAEKRQERSLDRNDRKKFCGSDVCWYVRLRRTYKNAADTLGKLGHPCQ